MKGKTNPKLKQILSESNTDLQNTHLIVTHSVSGIGPDNINHLDKGDLRHFLAGKSPKLVDENKYTSNNNIN